MDSVQIAKIVFTLTVAGLIFLRMMRIQKKKEEAANKTFDMLMESRIPKAKHAEDEGVLFETLDPPGDFIEYDITEKPVKKKKKKSKVKKKSKAKKKTTKRTKK